MIRDVFSEEIRRVCVCVCLCVCVRYLATLRKRRISSLITTLITSRRFSITSLSLITFRHFTDRVPSTR